MRNKTLVFGASLNPERYSNKAILLLRQYGFETKGFGLRQGTVSDIEIYTNKISQSDIHTITLYMNPKRLKQHWAYILSLQPIRLIFNPGTEDVELINDAKKYGIRVDVACTLVLLRTGQYSLD